MSGRRQFICLKVVNFNKNFFYAVWSREILAVFFVSRQFRFATIPFVVVSFSVNTNELGAAMEFIRWIKSCKLFVTTATIFTRLYRKVNQKTSSLNDNERNGLCFTTMKQCCGKPCSWLCRFLGWNVEQLNSCRYGLIGHNTPHTKQMHFPLELQNNKRETMPGNEILGGQNEVKCQKKK